MSCPKPSPDEAFKEFTKHAGRVFRELGFTGSGQNYRRARGEQWQAINFQRSQWRVDRHDPIYFYVNIGIDFPALRFKRWSPLPASISKFIATKADTTFRIEDLCPQSGFERFAHKGIDAGNLEVFKARFARVLADQLVPQLDMMATPEGLARVLRRIPWMATVGSRAFVGKSLAPPVWDPAEREAGKWKQDRQGLWWGPGEL